jgi:hypothetical protein
MLLSEVTDRLSTLVGRKPMRLPVPAFCPLGTEAAAMLGVPRRAGALAELDGESTADSTLNALTAVPA